MAIKKRSKPSLEFSFASAADIVFLLLIYFLLTSTFVTQSSLDIELPTSASDKPSPDANFVSIKADGTFSWKTAGSSERILNERDELRPLVQSVLEDDNKDNDVITLRVDKRSVFDDPAFVIALVAEFQGKIVIMTEKN
ncbi:MAG: biopolymer transporter ExbD [Bacteroidia bacterium]|nr:biopolymer transporter ExbD [Bacteroidia bacterium]